MMHSISAMALVLFGAAASASSLSVGSAKIVNKCSYDVYLCNVPAEGGGYSEQDKTLSTGDSWSQTWTELSNGEGWSIKLSNSTSLASILQYEYTFHADGTIWFDLSCVNGDPWPENWELTGDNGCDPKQTAYRFPTDDDYGMQACTQDASIELTLCASENSGSDSSSSAAAPAYTSVSSSVSSASAHTTSSTAQAPASTSASTSVSTSTYTSVSSSTKAVTTAQPTSSSSESSAAPSATQYSHVGGWGWFSTNQGGEVQAQENYAPPVAGTPTTLATSTTVVAVTSQEADGAIVTVVDVETAYATAVVTAFARDAPPAVVEAPGRHRRHEHHAHNHA